MNTVNNDDWLKKQCNRYANGECQTVACLKRGKGMDGTVHLNYENATCEAHEILKELEVLRKK